MKLPLQITTRNVSLSEAAADTIREKAAKLETFYDRIMACRVLVEAPHRHKQQGLHYNVRLDITVPGGEIVVRREPNEDLYIAIRDSFDAARRQLQGFVRRQRGEVKLHESTPAGQLVDLHEEYGFVETGDDREAASQRSALRADGDFDELEPEFLEERGEEGPQAVAMPRHGT